MIPSVVSKQVRETVLDYLKTTFSLANKDLEESLFDFLDGPEGLFKGPYVDIRLPFRKRDAGERIPLDIKPDFEPYKHQVKAFQRLYSKEGHQPQQTLVTTGTGSGKTECFLYPILDHCWLNRDKPGIKAIILYPMNALATDQAGRLAEMLWSDERLKGEVSAGLYVGGNGRHAVSDEKHLIDQRDVLRDSPPDILLTNYKMLDFLLLRPEDRRLWQHNEPDTLRYLVLDELHTYDGAQGSDVACLLRRLKNRLQVEPGSLCCVGTSATIGDDDERSVSALTQFASKVFDAYFAEESLITESRQSPQEALGDTQFNHDPPYSAPASELDPASFREPAAWIGHQTKLWLGLDGPIDPLIVGEALKSSHFLRQLLKVLEGRPLSLNEVDSRLCTRDPEWRGVESPEQRLRLLSSFIGLVSFAKSRDGGREVPFLTVQVQLWLRELRHLVQKVVSPGEAASFSWASDHLSADDHHTHWLPLAYCRECGNSGFASCMRVNEETLQDDLSEVGKAWLHRSQTARYVRVSKQTDDLFPQFVNPQSLVVGSNPTEKSPIDGRNIECLPALVTAELSTQTPPRSLTRCPDCGGESCLSILGSRAPSLLSVAISDMFTSAYNADKKLLAFTDSVQDASHRAGFFGARTYRFNIRTAIQCLLEPNQAPVALTDYAEQMFESWMQDESVSRERLISTLMPPDLREHPDYLAFLDSEGKGSHKRLQEDLIDRLGWEITMEYGLRARVGRTLESTHCSTIVLNNEVLDDATERLMLELNEDSPLDGRRSGFELTEVRHFLRGLIYRARTRGAIFHPFLQSYVNSVGNPWFLRKSSHPLISPFGRFSVYPRFLTNHSQGPGTRETPFDAIIASASSHTWHRDWVARTFGVAVNDSGTNHLYNIAMTVLTSAGVLREFDATPRCKVWGIDPAVLRVGRETARVMCPECGTEALLPAGESAEWVGSTCTMYRCDGAFEQVESQKDTYYSRIYKSGQLYRVFPEEHTGLLGRQEREDLEEAFRTQKRPNGPNMLVATPTLEMGIDIGDLSALVLCSVPPTTSNYIQRVGRAGRKTGNAFCMTLVNARPHDLYFHESPEEMMAGSVVPPGCFLDTPEMLKRQMVAHGMDAWSREDEDAGRIPAHVNQIQKLEDPSKFPGRFLSYYEKHHAALTESFLNRFSDELSPENMTLLRHFGDSDTIQRYVLAAFERVRNERDELKKTRRNISGQIKNIEKNVDEVENADIQLQDLRFARGVIGRLIEEQGGKYPLNVLTDEGVLPNYAFPEAGVTLDSVIRDDKGDGQREYTSREFIRPASSALRELAPFNTFYAEGRKVQIDEIDIGSAARPLTERWRLCAECSYAERVTDEAGVAVECPRCGDSGAWSDSGQLRTMVNFRRSRSLATRLEASTVDDSDDREEEFYKTADLIDVAPENMNGARTIAELPFGYELLKGLTLREVNFGREFDGGQGLKISGIAIGDRGFDVCLDCSKVRKSSSPEIEHAPYCKSKRKNQEPKVESVFLYRQIESEAIRILMPFADVGLAEKRASFKAALELGFRRHFQGDPVHLQIKESREPIPGGGYRQFLVIFDAVPGGTGYLSELWRTDNFMGVLQLALTALQSCQCQKDEHKDGCYRCLFAYQRQKELALISSQKAQETLLAILSKAKDLQDIQTLSEVSLDTRLESELEDKFIAALAARAQEQKDCSWREIVLGGEVRWRLKIDAKEWEIQAQVLLGKKESVNHGSKPDFLIRRVDSSDRQNPIALFCDGFAYHGCPDSPEGRIWDDVVKRRSILDSGRYHIWSVAWKDVELFEKGTGSGPCVFGDDIVQKVQQLATAKRLKLPVKVGRASSMEMLWKFLGQPEPDEWSGLANIWSVAWLSSDQPKDPDVLGELEVQLQKDEVLSGPPLIPMATGIVTQMGRVDWGEYLHVLALCQQVDLASGDFDSCRLVLRLDDSDENRSANDFETSWRSFLQAWNLLQFKCNVEVQTTERIQNTDPSWDIEMEMQQAAESEGVVHSIANSEVDELIEYSPESVRELLLHLSKNALTLPSIDYELDLGSGRCGPQPELAWPDYHLAVLAENQVEDLLEFESRGWTLFQHPIDKEEVASELRHRMHKDKIEDQI